MRKNKKYTLGYSKSVGYIHTFIRVFKDMELRLLEEGLNPSASSDERLCLLWNLLMSGEETVRALKQQIQDLNKQHNTEIEKVRGPNNKIDRYRNEMERCVDRLIHGKEKRIVG